MLAPLEHPHRAELGRRSEQLREAAQGSDAVRRQACRQERGLLVVSLQAPQHCLAVGAISRAAEVKRDLVALVLRLLAVPATIPQTLELHYRPTHMCVNPNDAFKTLLESSSSESTISSMSNLAIPLLPNQLLASNTR
eukprot:763481-Hanusia_phi.AAC.1